MWSVLGAPSLTESLSEVLRQQIIRDEVTPGLRLTVACRKPLHCCPTYREGWLDRLCAEGPLRRGPCRGSSVVPLLSANDITDIYVSRESV